MSNVKKMAIMAATGVALSSSPLWADHHEGEATTQKKHEVQGALGISSYSFSDTKDYTGLQKPSYSGIDLNINYGYQFWFAEKFVVVPQLGFNYQAHSTDIKNTAGVKQSKSETSFMGAFLGIKLGIDAYRNAKLSIRPFINPFFKFGNAYGKTTPVTGTNTEFDGSYSSFGAGLGVEVPFVMGFVPFARFDFAGITTKTKLKNVTNATESTVKSGNTSIVLGVAYHF